MEQNNDIVLKTTGLTKRYGKKIAVNNVNMTIKRGDIYGFIGKNGAGKTTFMKLVLELATKNAGEVEILGKKSVKSVGSKIGALIEAPGYYSSCSAYENMKRFAILKNADISSINEILEFVGLSDTGKKKAGKFSLGMKQRLGLAIALLGNPEFLILDEPVNGLDPAGMKEIRDIILKLNREKGITVLISSHLLDELAKIVTRYGIIENGVLIEEITADELNKKCQNKLMLRVDNPNKAYEILSPELPAGSIVISGDSLLISEQIDNGAKFNMMLAQNGIMVSAIDVVTEGLEQYFMERIGA